MNYIVHEISVAIADRLGWALLLEGYLVAAVELTITLNSSPRLDLRARGDSDTPTNAGEMANPSVPLDGCSAIDPGVESNENTTGCVVRIFFCPLAFL